MTNTLFKQFKLFGLFMAFSLALSAMAAPKAAESAADKEARQSVDAVVYNLANLKNDKVIQDLARRDGAAGGYLSMSVGSDLAARWITAIQLYKQIALSHEVSEDTKREIMPRLADQLRTLFITISRQQGDDPINLAKDGHLEESGAKKVNPALQFVTLIAKDMGNSIADLVRFNRSANDELTYKVWERMIRDIVGQDIAIEAQKVIMEIGDLKGQGSDDALRLSFAVAAKDKEDKDDWGAAERVRDVRQSRKVAHLTTVGTILGMAVIWYGFKNWDFVGTFSGTYSESTVRMSGTIFAGIVGTLLAIKQVTANFRVIPTLNKLIEVAEKPGFKTEPSPLRLPLLARVTGLKKKYEEAKKTCMLKLNSSQASAAE